MARRERYDPVQDRSREGGKPFDARSAGGGRPRTCFAFEGKKIVGHNTDAEGLRDALKMRGRRSRSGKHTLIFGAGGAARAAGLRLRGKTARRTVRFTTRTSSTAKNVYATWRRTSRKRAFRLGRRGTPIFGSTRRLWASKVTLIFRLRRGRYGPRLRRWTWCMGRKRRFNGMPQRLGARTLDGTAMLVFQALRALEFWDRPSARRAARRAGPKN